MTVDDKLDCIFDYIEYLCVNEDFDLVNIILSKIDYHKYSSDELLGYLTITIPFKDKLTERKFFAYCVRNKLLEKHDWDEVSIIMKGLI